MVEERLPVHAFARVVLFPLRERGVGRGKESAGLAVVEEGDETKLLQVFDEDGESWVGGNEVDDCRCSDDTCCPCQEGSGKQEEPWASHLLLGYVCLGIDGRSCLLFSVVVELVGIVKCIGSICCKCKGK